MLEINISGKIYQKGVLILWNLEKAIGRHLVQVWRENG